MRFRPALPVILRSASAAIAFGGLMLTYGGMTRGSLRSLFGRSAHADRTGGGAQLFGSVLQRVAQDYVDSLSGAQLYRKATDGLLGELGDPADTYVPPESVEHVTDSTRLALHPSLSHVRIKAARLAPGVADITVHAFADSTARDLRRAVDSLRRSGLRSLVLDLRGNSSRPLDRGIAIAELFLRPGETVGSLHTRGPNRVHTVVAPNAGGASWDDLRLFILVDSTSGAAAEVVAGALQDNHRAVIVGTQSAGEGSSHTLFPVGAGAVRLTTARWFTPAGHRIDRPRFSDDDDVPVSDSIPAAANGGITPNVIAGDTAVVHVALGLALHPSP